MTPIILIILLLSGPAFAKDVTISYDAPEFNEDGTPLTDLSGYLVNYGPVSRFSEGFIGYPVQIDVEHVLSYQLTGLDDSAPLYCSVTAYDTSGNESKFSNELELFTCIMIIAAEGVRTEYCDKVEIGE